MSEAQDIKSHWREAAPRWRRHGAIVREMTEPVSRALVDAVGPREGERWLDIASGVGDPASLLAARVGASGTVVVSDLVHEMAAAAADTIDGRSSAVTAAAEALPFRSQFDGATCRFGAMFFADPGLALSQIREALEPGGRAVFAVWGGRERNPFFNEVWTSVREVVPDVPAPEPDEPHPFRYAPAGKFAALVRSAGWIDVEERSLPFLMGAGLALEEFWDYLISFSGDLEKLVEDLPTDRRAMLRAGLEDRLGPYFRDGTMRFPAEARLVLARSPGDASR